jgi:hypothetical protein
VLKQRTKPWYVCFDACVKLLLLDAIKKSELNHKERTK